MGIRPDGRGNVSESHVAWHAQNARCYVPSPVVVDGYLVVADDRGTVNCYNASSGERYWQERLAPHYSASLIAGAGHVYLVSDDGTTKVVRPGPEPEVLAENHLQASISASPAISDGQLFIRSERHLYCIGD